MIFILFIILICAIFVSWHFRNKYYNYDNPNFKKAIKAYLAYIIPTIVVYLIIFIIVVYKFISIKMGSK